MDPELKRLLQENLAVAKNNNEVLRTIRHHQWISSLTSIIFWVVVVAAPIYFYQAYIQPFLSAVTPGATTTKLFSIPSSADIQKLIDSFKAAKPQ